MAAFTREQLDALSRKLADEGKLIEAGWLGFRAMTMPADVGEAQVRDMRIAFMAGAQHLFSSLMSILEPDAEPTAADMLRMDLINAELLAFGAELKRRAKR